jgi:hypothetical protein
MKQGSYNIVELSRNYWDVVRWDGESLGTILGGGPTAATRYKAITPGCCAMDPDQAPGGYARSLVGAAEALAEGSVVY